MEIPVRSGLRSTSVKPVTKTQFRVCESEAGNREETESEAHRSSMNGFFRVSTIKKKPKKNLRSCTGKRLQAQLSVPVPAWMCVRVCVSSVSVEKPLRFFWLYLRLGQTPLDILFTPCKLLPHVP